jgi:hypothetical protein
MQRRVSCLAHKGSGWQVGEDDILIQIIYFVLEKML